AALVAVAAKKRQQEIDDSLKTAAKVRQQQIDDSLRNVAKLRQQQIDDSIKNAALIAAATKPHPVDTSAAAAASNEALEQRDNVLVQTFHISTPDILIELFDNAEIDGDMVSVYHNDTLLVNNAKLLTKAITLAVHADAVNRKHEFILVANNLGTIPPNTALMRIT